MKSLFKLACVALALTLIAVPALAQSSKRTPKKYALFVGISDYPGMGSDLGGAVPDAVNLRNALTAKYDFRYENVATLTDSQATRDAILNGIGAVAKKAAKGDLFVFSYSGHGSLFPDEASEQIDEKDPVEVNMVFSDGSEYTLPKGLYDSTIVPYDALLAPTSGKPWENMILDDELYTLFSSMTSKGVSVVFISDSCHSGTITKGQFKNKDAAIRFMAPEKILKLKGKKLSEFTPAKPKNQVQVKERSFSGNLIAFGASKDSQVSWDGGIGGLFTSILMEGLLASGPDMTYGELMEWVRPSVEEISLGVYGFTQTPQIDTRFGKASTKLFSVGK